MRIQRAGRFSCGAMRRNGPTFSGKRRTVHRVRNDYIAFKNAGVEFGKREDDAVVVGSFKNNIRGHGWTAHLLASWYACFAENLFERDSFVSLFLL